MFVLSHGSFACACSQLRAEGEAGQSPSENILGRIFYLLQFSVAFTGMNDLCCIGFPFKFSFNSLCIVIQFKKKLTMVFC